jgi:hypothetical protein
VSTQDILILVPLIPLAPFLIIWYLPWESWLWDRLPKRLRKLTGPYLIYGAFAAWHFKLHWWAILSPLVCGVVMSAWAVQEMIKAPQKNDST